MIDLDTIQAEVDAAVSAGGNIAGAIAPKYQAYILLGQIVARSAPQLVANIEALFTKDAVTADTKEKVASAINALLNPESA